MVLNQQAKNIISSHVSNRIESYYDLKADQQRELIIEILRDLDRSDKACLLSDGDYHSVLPELVIDVIKTNASEDAVKKLVNGIMGVFVYGIRGINPANYLDIEECFEEEWGEQHAQVNEHWRHDCIQRTNDARAY